MAIKADLLFAWRAAARNPGYSFLIVVVLAIGIGANTAIFGLANAAFFRAPPYPHPERLAFLWQNNQRTGESEGAVSYPNYRDWRAQSRTFEDMAFLMFPSAALNGGTSELLNGRDGPERVPGAVVSANFFSILGVQPLLGRTFLVDAAIGGKPSAVVISYSMWKSRFGGDPHTIGRNLDPYQGDAIVGIMPPGFDFPAGAQIWRPRQLPRPSNFDLRLYPNLGVIGRLNAGIGWSQAQTEMDAIATRLAAEYPNDDSGIGIRIVPLRKQLSEKVSQGLLVLWAAIFGVLLIACLNAANLMMARAAGRQKEIAVRFSLGATRGRIVKQFLAESLLLAAIGAAAGFLLAAFALALVSKFNADIARLGGSLLDARVLLYTVALAAFTSLICGILPAFSTSRLDLHRALKETTGAVPPGAQLIRKVLIVLEVSLAFVLLAGSGLLIRSLWQIFSVNPGFDADKVYSLHIDSPPRKDPGEVLASRVVQMTDRIRALPGVSAVGSTSNVLFPDEMFKGSFVIEGRADSPGQSPSSTAGDASRDLFRAMGIPLLSGRVFTDADTRKNAPPVVIINQAMARLYWPDEDPIGKRLKFGDPNFPQPWQTIVGVVGDVHEEGLEKSPGAMAYLPSSGYPGDDLVVRASGDRKTLLAAIKDQVAAVDKDCFVDHFAAVSDILSTHESEREFNAWLLSAFAFIALLLAAVGIYGSISYWVKQRTQEVGIRMALGAQPRNIFALVIGRGMAVIFVGLALGVAGALALTRLLLSMLFTVKPADPLTYSAVALLLATVALAACYFPARRAMAVDPMIALRHE